jgi:hypothetical protein
MAGRATVAPSAPNLVPQLADCTPATPAAARPGSEASSGHAAGATDLDALRTRRARVLEVADLIVPGLGPAFEVTGAVPR